MLEVVFIPHNYYIYTVADHHLIHHSILNNQRQVLERLFYPNVLARIQDAELKFDKADALTMPELFSEITDAVWSELGRKLDGKRRLHSDSFISSFRRGLQREHLKILVKLVLEVDSGTPEDARSLAWRDLVFISSRIDQKIRDDKKTGWLHFGPFGRITGKDQESLRCFFPHRTSIVMSRIVGHVAILKN